MIMVLFALISPITEKTWTGVCIPTDQQNTVSLQRYSMLTRQGRSGSHE